ncbi:hypothetical protein [Pseudomonas aeruginosa]|uniref:hypothetical protein n=1 Tax=Pseudomonas aeruginosa TaxID=287 RepID=UPI00053E9F44|nr:hypothetical protein [Pseudomonas aeruginosa]EJH4830390.1 hypothetical protein [Pseudomonas aeruginosa]EKX5105810.1 hypothetical protein [Pseudomonas aeruginosa]EKX8762931.1 hypothetical protein [Pseudomonas aeruginosa]EMC2521720.1 hypothetical protein [Pseudomonas aeruginosa]EMF0829516.1 hypothetical protein [Pseudomonas aeruginosa]
MAVHLEPITFSGERITIAVAVVPEDETPPKVISTLLPEPLEQVFGQYGKHLFNLAGNVISELQAYLFTGGPLESWEPSMQGVFVGKVIPTRNTSIQTIIKSALTHSSLFSAKGNDAARGDAADRSLNKFQEEIKKLVLASREGMKVRFNQKMPLYGGKAKVSITYVGTHLAINLATLDTTLTSHSQQRDAAHRKINQLLALREIAIGHKHDQLMMGLWTPKRDLSEHQEDLFDAYTTELEFASNRAGVQYILADGAIDLGQAALPFAKKILEDA